MGEDMIIAAEAAVTPGTGQIWAAVITALAALLVVALSASSGSLPKAERLSEIAEKMRHLPERRLIEDLRDDYVTAWALGQMAPRHNGWRTVTYAFYIAGVTVLAVWLVMVALAHELGFGWWVVYAAGLFLVGIGGVFNAVRNAKRANWMRMECAARSVKPPQYTGLLKTFKLR